MTFWITLNYDVEIKVIADNLRYISDKDIYMFIDNNGNEIMSLFGGIFELSIVFESGSIVGHVDICDGHLIVDYEKGTDADFDTHSVDVQNGEGYYNDCGKYVSYHKHEL